jgi:hypothetical protein
MLYIACVDYVNTSQTFTEHDSCSANGYRELSSQNSAGMVFDESMTNAMWSTRGMDQTGMRLP